MSSSHSGGIHIIADLYGCDFSHFFDQDEVSITRIFSDLIQNAGLSYLGGYVHIFGSDSFTGVFALAESHISIHTWPERGYTSVDVFVCNHTEDNTAKAHAIYGNIEKLLCPEAKNIEIIERSMEKNHQGITQKS